MNFYLFDMFFYQNYSLGICECFEDYVKEKPLLPFYQILNRYLSMYGLLKRNLAKSCGIDRRIIYKIYHQKDFKPTKRLVLCLGLGLRLSKEDFEAFLHDAGYHLSVHQKTDVVMMFCLQEGIYSLTEVNLYLDRVGEKILPA